MKTSGGGPDKAFGMFPEGVDESGIALSMVEIAVQCRVTATGQGKDGPQLDTGCYYYAGKYRVQ